MTLRQGYEYMLRQTPAAAISIREDFATRKEEFDIEILPASDRRRFSHDSTRDLNFYLDKSPGRYLPVETFPPVLHRFKVYNNTIMTVSTPDLSRVDPRVADAYRDLGRAVMAGVPAARGGGFDVYLHGKRLAWVKEACEPGALRREFWLKLYPADAGRLPDHHRKRGYFVISVRGVRFDSKCLGAARLPDYPLARMRLGQSVPGGGLLWEVEAPL